MASEVQFIKVCNVVSVKDNTGMDRIKVRMVPEDNELSDEEIISRENNYVFPAIPKLLFVKPKVGECVLVICATNNGDTQRYYLGPVISQQNQINYDSFMTTARSMFKGSIVPPLVSPTMDTETKGSFPENDDVYITGRRNADLQIKENDIRMRCGVKKASWADKSKFKFNITDPAYILLRYYDLGLDNSGVRQNKCNSVANIVADKINLLGTNSKDNYQLTDREDLITDDEMKKIIEKAHQLPYGDKLVEILDMFRKAFLNHMHNHYLVPPNPGTESMAELTGYDFKKMLSDTVRIAVAFLFNFLALLNKAKVSISVA